MQVRGRKYTWNRARGHHSDVEISPSGIVLRECLILACSHVARSYHCPSLKPIWELFSKGVHEFKGGRVIKASCLSEAAPIETFAFPHAPDLIS